MLKLSLTMIVKNEAVYLERCLQSVKHIVDEIIIVDTGSNDNTKEIARREGAAIFDYTWNNNFSDARNYSIQQSTGDWNLILDADEYIADDYKKEYEKKIRSFIEENRAIGRIKLTSRFMQDGIEKLGETWISRLLPKGVYYEGRIHEQPLSELPRMNTGVEVLHDGYFETNKAERNLELLYLEREKNPEDTYLLYQLGKEHKIAREYSAAAVFLKECYDLLEGTESFFPNVVVDYLYTIIANGNMETGLPIIEQQVVRLNDYPDFYFVCGLFYMNLILSNIEKYSMFIPDIEKSYQFALAIGETEKYDTVRGTGTFLAAYNLGVFYETFGNILLAKKYYEQAAVLGYQQAIERLSRL